MAYGETEEENAKRELEEEMGIKVDKLDLLWTQKYEDESTRSYGSIFMTKFDGEAIPQPEEVESVAVWSV